MVLRSRQEQTTVTKVKMFALAPTPCFSKYHEHTFHTSLHQISQATQITCSYSCRETMLCFCAYYTWDRLNKMAGWGAIFSRSGRPSMETIWGCKGIISTFGASSCRDFEMTKQNSKKAFYPEASKVGILKEK